MARICEKNRCYEAEHSVQRIFLPSEAAKTFLPDEPEGYIAFVRSEPWFKAAYSNHDAPITVEVSERASHSFWRRHDRTIRLAVYPTVVSWEWSCLHEVAHSVTPGAGCGTRGVQGHGHGWRVNYVYLVRMMVGRRAAKYLRHAFLAHELPMRDNDGTFHP
jgi:hypothetical protein